jgi:hypothetical protein
MDPSPRKHYQNGISQNSMLMDPELGENALKSVCNALSDIDRTKAVGGKDLKWVEIDPGVARVDFVDVNAVEKSARKGAFDEALRVVKNDRGNLLLDQLAK